MHEPRANHHQLAALAGILAAFAAAGILFQPAVINGDGVGYLKQLDHGALSPGHLLYLPLARWLVHVAGVGGGTMLQAAPLLRWLSLVCALLTLLFFWDTARRLVGGERALPLVALLGASHAFMRSALEVETYAPATLACVVALWALARGMAGGVKWAILAGLAAGVAAGLHTSMVLLAPALILCPRRARRVQGAALACLAAGLTLGLILAWAAGEQGISGAGELWRWLRSSDHGVPYPHGWRTAPAALWGLARALAHAPYPYEAGLGRAAAYTALAAAAWIALLLLRGPTRGEAGEPSSRPLLLAWVLPLTLFALYFYPSDTERWIFVLPALFLLAAPRPGRWTWALVLVLALVNMLGYQLPLRLDRAEMERAAAAERLLTEDDLLVSPGHGWEEMVGLGTNRTPELFPLIHYAGARGPGEAVVLMWRRMREAHAAGGNVYVARLRGSPDPRGFKELALLGVTRADFVSMFDIYREVKTPVEGLWKLETTGTQ